MILLLNQVMLRCAGGGRIPGLADFAAIQRMIV
jgi:hypothetical protein